MRKCNNNNKNKQSHSCVAQGNRIMWGKHTLQCIFQLCCTLNWISSLISNSSELLSLFAALSLVSATLVRLTAPLLGALQLFIHSNDSNIPFKFFFGFLIWFLFISFFFRSRDSCLLPGEPCPESEMYSRNTRGIWLSKDLWKLTSEDNNSGPSSE